jgi:hypothetical protein
MRLIYLCVCVCVYTKLAFVVHTHNTTQHSTTLIILALLSIRTTVVQMSNTTGGISLKQMNMWAVLRKFKYFVLKMAGCFLFAAGITLRYIPHNTNDIYPATFRWARVLLSIDISLFFMRGLEFFLISKTVGPKLTMISGMASDNIIKTISQLITLILILCFRFMTFQLLWASL